MIEMKQKVNDEAGCREIFFPIKIFNVTLVL